LNSMESNFKNQFCNPFFSPIHSSPAFSFFTGPFSPTAIGPTAKQLPRMAQPTSNSSPTSSQLQHQHSRYRVPTSSTVKTSRPTPLFLPENGRPITCPPQCRSHSRNGRFESSPLTLARDYNRSRIPRPSSSIAHVVPP
jgi:hypothetical protein